MRGATASRAAAKEYSPRRKPWVMSINKSHPEGAKEINCIGLKYCVASE